MNNELRVGQSRMPSAFDIPYDKALFDQYGIKGIPKTTYPSSNDHGLTLFAPSGYAQLGSRAFWPNTNNLYVTQFNDVLFRSAGNHGLKAGVEYKHENIYRVRGPLCTRPDDLQPRIYRRSSEPQRHRRRPGGIHARLAGGRQSRQREWREPDGELPRRVPAGHLESVVPSHVEPRRALRHLLRAHLPRRPCLQFPPRLHADGRRRTPAANPSAKRQRLRLRSELPRFRSAARPGVPPHRQNRAARRFWHHLFARTTRFISSPRVGSTSRRISSSTASPRWTASIRS